MLVDWDAHCVGLLFFEQSSTERYVVVAFPMTAHTALHGELVTQVARLDIHVKVILAHDDDQLAEPKA